MPLLFVSKTLLWGGSTFDFLISFTSRRRRHFHSGISVDQTSKDLRFSGVFSSLRLGRCCSGHYATDLLFRGTTGESTYLFRVPGFWQCDDGLVTGVCRQYMHVQQQVGSCEPPAVHMHGVGESEHNSSC